jgi:hypothetical protein
MIIKQITLLKEAVADLEDGKSFYNQIYNGAGDYFWDSLVSDIKSLILYAGIHKKYSGYYRMLAKRFPYSIILRN